MAKFYTTGWPRQWSYNPTPLSIEGGHMSCQRHLGVDWASDHGLDIVLIPISWYAVTSGCASC